MNTIKMILTPWQSALSAKENVKNVTMFEAALKVLELPYKEVLGVWQGEKEVSFIMDYDVEFLTHVICEYNQDAVLVMDDQGNGYLRNKGCKVLEPIGKYKEVSKEDAEKCDGYTYDAENNTYFIFE